MASKIHGGARKGAGRKPSPNPRKVRKTITLEQDQIDWLLALDPNLSKAIRLTIETIRDKHD